MTCCCAVTFDVWTSVSGTPEPAAAAPVPSPCETTCSGAAPVPAWSAACVTFEVSASDHSPIGESDSISCCVHDSRPGCRPSHASRSAAWITARFTCPPGPSHAAGSSVISPSNRVCSVPASSGTLTWILRPIFTFGAHGDPDRSTVNSPPELSTVRVRVPAEIALI